MNSATGELSFSIEDGTEIVPGKEYELEFFLSPGRASHTKRLKLTVLPECTLETDSYHFYVAQKLKLNVLNALGTYSAEIISGEDCVDIDENDHSVIYGRKAGKVVASLRSSRPADDPQIDLTLDVGNIYIYSSWVSGAPTTACIDGTPVDLDIIICDDDDTSKELDKSTFDPKRLEMYFPATVTWTPYGEFSPDVFLDMNPYTMQMSVKKMYGEKFVLDYRSAHCKTISLVELLVIFCTDTCFAVSAVLAALIAGLSLEFALLVVGQFPLACSLCASLCLLCG